MSRDERIARNEATAREINEEIEEAQATQNTDSRYLRLVCECGDVACEHVVAVTHSEYERVRRHSRRFLVRHEHIEPDVEHLVEQTERFAVVEKRDGSPGEIADAEDPRG